eukprot:4659118-Prymnesium_polylepis.1
MRRSFAMQCAVRRCLGRHAAWCHPRLLRAAVLRCGVVRRALRPKEENKRPTNTSAARGSSLFAQLGKRRDAGGGLAAEGEDPAESFDHALSDHVPRQHMSKKAACQRGPPTGEEQQEGNTSQASKAMSGTASGTERGKGPQRTAPDTSARNVKVVSKGCGKLRAYGKLVDDEQLKPPRLAGSSSRSTEPEWNVTVDVSAEKPAPTSVTDPKLSFVLMLIGSLALGSCV